MSSNFLSLPRELRDQIYELVLVHQESISPWEGKTDQLSPGLFRVNRTIHYEATSLFYSQNRFDFTARPVEAIGEFLGQIGRNNADYIQHVRINFPEFRVDRESGKVTLGDYEDGILTTVLSGCANLRALTLSNGSVNLVGIPLDALEKNAVNRVEALNLVNARVRAISSLQKIIVEMYEGDADTYLRREMERQRWKTTFKEDK